MPNDMQGHLSREEQHLAEPTAADILAFIDAQRGSVNFDNRRFVGYVAGSWRAQKWAADSGDFLLNERCSSIHEALLALIAHEMGDR